MSEKVETITVKVGKSTNRGFRSPVKIEKKKGRIWSGLWLVV